MMDAEFLSTSEARKVLSDLVNQVKYQGKEFSIGRHGKAEARLVPVVVETEEAEVKVKDVEVTGGAEFDEAELDRAAVDLIKSGSAESSEPGAVKPDFHEHIRSQRVAKNQTVKYDSHALKYEYAKLAKKYNLDLIVLFGSHAKERIKPDSDVDIAVFSKKDLHPRWEQNIYSDLVDLFGRDDIDVVNLNRTHDVLIRYEILTAGKALFEKEPNLFSKLRMRSWFEYQDFRHYFDRMDQVILNRLKNLTSN